VLELATAAEPGLTADLRVLETWGPAAMPPLLASTRVPAATRRVLTDALLTMHHHPAGRAALALGSASRFAPVRDQDYDPIRRMAALGERYALIPTCSQPIA
jgi:phosphonate transport system substrate-binding protein